jgi:hypothetical protein
MRKGKVRLDVVSKKRLLLSTVLASLLIIYIYLGNIGGCGGGGNESIPPEVQEFTLFMGLSQIELSDGFESPCPKSSADLELQLKLVGEKVSGEARLIGFGMLGNATELSGVVEDGSITIEPFSVNVNDGRPIEAPLRSGPSSISFIFHSFIGMLIGADYDQTTHTLELDVSGRVSEIEGGDAIICDGDFTMVRIADDCIPETFFAHSDCLAESISKACNFVTGCATAPVPGGVHGDFWIGWGRQADCTCEVIDCNSLVCPFPVSNVHYDPVRGLAGIDPDNPTEFTFTCRIPFGP